MATDKQKSASQNNGRKGAGRKSAKGKKISRMNACKHGLFAKVCLLLDEDPDEFEAFRKAMLDDLQSVGKMEAFFADEAVQLAWRILRIPRFEAYLHEYQKAVVETVQLERVIVRAKECFIWVPTRARREDAPEEVIAAVANDLHDLAIAEYIECEGRAGLGHAIARALEKGYLLGKLSRYEAGLRRSYLRFLHELERLQAKRHGDIVPPPVVIDVTVDGDPSSPT